MTQAHWYIAVPAAGKRQEQLRSQIVKSTNFGTLNPVAGAAVWGKWVISGRYGLTAGQRNRHLRRHVCGS
jgi:hypothetical protein